jgi:hypothetical protein
MYSVSYNEKKKMFVVYKGDTRIKEFKSEQEAWKYIRLMITE